MGFGINLYAEDTDKYDYETYLERVDLDKFREEKIMAGEGFVVTQLQSSLKKDLKSPYGIYSPKFGQTLGDVNPFEDSYKCKCGRLKGRKNRGKRCPNCDSIVERVESDLGYYGFLVLDNVCTMHPVGLKALSSYIGNKVFMNIITPINVKDENGYTKAIEKPKGEPFYGIGIEKLQEHLDEVIEFYHKSSKEERYKDILKIKDIIFTHTIPVFSTILRPYRLEGDKFTFEGTNSIYSMMTKNVLLLNKRGGRKRSKSNDELLFDLTMKYQELYTEIENIMVGKKGRIRGVYSGRCSFSNRSVIISNAKLRIDEIRLSYHALVELLQQRIINVLQKSYNISFSAAYNIWEDAQRRENSTVREIINSIIKSYPHGLPFLIIRNPTIAYGSVLQMYVVGICESHVMELPLQILPLLAADFDGDVLNALLLLNKTFISSCEQVFNPRNAMYISRNDGKLNMDVIHTKDTIINLNSMIQLSREKYSQEQIDRIKYIQSLDY